MLKHVMLITFRPHGPELDSWMCGKWPNITEAETEAMHAMVGEFPHEMRLLIEAMNGMQERMRFLPNAKLVILDDLEEGITTREEMKRYLKYLPREKLIEICRA